MQAAGPLQGRNIAREYLQARILGVLQREGAMMSLAFLEREADVELLTRENAVRLLSERRQP